MHSFFVTDSTPREPRVETPLDQDEPLTMFTLVCLVLASIVSGLAVFSLMRAFVG